MMLKDNKFSKLNGLVLAGGESLRMGKAKEQISYHGKEQRYFAADLLMPFCDEVFISYRDTQGSTFDKKYRTLTDTFLNMGPLGGILSALRFDREKAWLVIACDLPLLDRESLAFLVANRSAGKVATTFENPQDALPEPLVTIWEPRSYEQLLQQLKTGNTSPRKLLIDGDAEILKIPNPDALRNVNTPRKAEIINNLLKRGRDK